MIKQVILITGASSGFGLMTAQHLAQAGHTVYASMRETAGRNAPQVAAIAAWAAEHDADLRTVELDVQSDASVGPGIAAVLAASGRLDSVDRAEDAGRFQDIVLEVDGSPNAVDNLLIALSAIDGVRQIGLDREDSES